MRMVLNFDVRVFSQSFIEIGRFRSLDAIAAADAIRTGETSRLTHLFCLSTVQ